MAMRKTTTTASKPAARKPRATAAAKPSASKAKAGNGAPPKVTMQVTHDQIAKKAYEIWVAKGCPQGQDYANWKEAEAALGVASA